MAHEVFTNEWAQAWCGKINSNQSYKDSAKDLEWSLILTLKGKPDTDISTDRSVFIDLRNGECVAGREATDDDFQSAPYIISADGKTWQKIFTGDLDIVTGIMWGKIKLEKGDVGTIAKYVSAAKQLVVSAMKVETFFPENL